MSNYGSKFGHLLVRDRWYLNVYFYLSYIALLLTNVILEFELYFLVIILYNASNVVLEFEWLFSTFLTYTASNKHMFISQWIFLLFMPCSTSDQVILYFEPLFLL